MRNPNTAEPTSLESPYAKLSKVLEYAKDIGIAAIAASLIYLPDLAERVAPSRNTPVKAAVENVLKTMEGATEKDAPHENPAQPIQAEKEMQK